MANIKSEQKDILTNEKNRLRNKSYKSQVRTAMKKVRVDVEKKVERATLDADFQHAISLIDRSVRMGIQKPNTGNRQKGQMWKIYNSVVLPVAEAK